MRCRDSQSPGTCETVRIRIDANHGGHVQDLGVPDDLDHEVGSDISRSNDCCFHLSVHSVASE